MRSQNLLPGALFLLAGCGDRLPVTGPTDAGSPSLTISDAVHSGGSRYFYFLPPLVAQPATTGVFDGALSPTVEICEFAGDCGQVVARFTTSNGTGGALVDIDVSAKQYSVNWDTRTCDWGPCTLDPAKTYRLRVSTNGRLLGFADLDVVATGSDLRNVQTGEFISLLNGRVLPVRFRIEGGIVGGISITPSPVTLDVGSATQLTAAVTDLHGDPLDVLVEWTSESPDIATIGATGVLNAVGGGCTRVTASAGGVEGVALVGVRRPGGSVVTGIERVPTGFEHLDTVSTRQFPRGGAYRARIRGSGLCFVSGVTFSDPAIQASSISATDTQVELTLRSNPVAERDTVHADIPGVDVTLVDWSSGIAGSGSGILDIVKGPPPRVIFTITNGVTAFVVGQQTRVEYLAEVFAVNNLRFEFVGGPSSPDGGVVFGPITGVYGYHWTRRITWTYTPPVPSLVGFVYGNVDGAGRNDQHGIWLPANNP